MKPPPIKAMTFVSNPVEVGVIKAEAVTFGSELIATRAVAAPMQPIPISHTSEAKDTFCVTAPANVTPTAEFTSTERYCSKVSGTGAMHVNALERFHWHINR